MIVNLSEHDEEWKTIRVGRWFGKTLEGIDQSDNTLKRFYLKNETYRRRWLREESRGSFIHHEIELRNGVVLRTRFCVED